LNIEIYSAGHLVSLQIGMSPFIFCSKSLACSHDNYFASSSELMKL